MESNPQKKIVLITGASSGIGAASAAVFAEKKANLILCARRHEKIKKLREKLCDKHGIKIHIAPLDITEKKSVDMFFSNLPEEFKELDILVNNAGLAAGLDKIQDSSVGDWEKMIDTNLKGLLYMTHSVLPGMIKRNRGHIINIGSIAGHGVYPKGAVYCATKHAVRTLSQGLRMDLCGTKVRVSTVEPGMVRTEFSLVRFKQDNERAQKTYEGFHPLEASDVADAIAYCAYSPDHVNIDDIVIMPLDQAALSMVNRTS